MRECGLKFPPLSAFEKIGAELMPSTDKFTYDGALMKLPCDIPVGRMVVELMGFSYRFPR